MDIEIDPWTPRYRLYERDGVSIIRTSDPQWVVKYAHSRDAIHKEIMFLKESLSIRNMIELPNEHQFGENWYAMRRYTGSVNAYVGVLIRRWHDIGVSVLNFLEDLHHESRRVHLDVTLRNILFDRDRGVFVVSDYELLESVSDDPALIDDNDDHLWYYIGAGAELSQPIRSWRMDLVMLGYALAELTWGSNPPSFSRLCQKRRTDSVMDINDYDIITRRNEEMTECHPTVRAYLDNVAKLVGWREEEPPARTVYDELRRLFTAQPES